MYEEFPAIYQLPVHLQQPVYFAEGLTRVELRLQLDTVHSKLMAWFTYKLTNEDGRHTYINKRWRRRQRELAIGRMLQPNTR